ncbi:MAG: sensor histidine kinase [Solirubrobacteraceae bacterium]
MGASAAGEDAVGSSPAVAADAVGSSPAVAADAVGSSPAVAGAGAARSVAARGEERPADARLPFGPLCWAAVLRLLLLAIVFAGDRLVAHPTVGTASFELIFALASTYGVLAFVESLRLRRHPPLWLFGGLDLVLVCALSYESGGAFSQLRWAFAFLPLGAALLRDPRRTAEMSLISVLAYLLVALIHPATHTQQLPLVLVQALYLVWVGAAAVVLSSLLARRQAHVAELAVQRGRLVAQALAAEDEARRALADGLHDQAVQSLLVARQDISEARAGETGAIDRAEAAVRAALQELRSTIRELHPYALEQLGLRAALEAIAEQLAARRGCDVQTQIDDGAAGVCDQLLVSLARELMSNAGRHANASRIALALSGDAEAIELRVADDGCGFAEPQLAGALRLGHIGLAACRERLRAVGGRMEIDSATGSGTTVRATIPRAAAPVPVPAPVPALAAAQHGRDAGC